MDESHAQTRTQYSEPLVYFEAVHEVTHRAARAVGGFVNYFFRIANHSVQLRFAGPALVPHIVPALAHLTTEPMSMPELTVYLWDSASTGTRMPPPTWNVGDQMFRGEVPDYSDGRFHTTYHAWAQVFNMLDSKLNLAVFWVADVCRLCFSMRGAPLRDILHWWLGNHGSQLVHGAGVGTPTAGVLLTGRGSSGKSTTALTCLNSGLLYAGDDHVLVSPEPTPFLHSLYNTAQLDVDSTYAFSDLLPSIKEPKPLNEAKVQVFLYEHCRKRIVRGFPLRAIVVPKVTGRPDTGLRRVSAAKILIALAPATIYALPEAGQEALHQMARLASEVPNYILELGTDLTRIPEVISQLLAVE